MNATIRYRIARARPLAEPEGSEMRWILVRSANVQTEQDRSAGLLPEADAAIFTSEVEANLFGFYLAELGGEKRP